MDGVMFSNEFSKCDGRYSTSATLCAVCQSHACTVVISKRQTFVSGRIAALNSCTLELSTNVTSTLILGFR